jgi:hypothetical protein
MKAHRIYLGARNDRGRFARRDLRLLTAILNRHFSGWSIFDAQGNWNGRTEQSKVITLVAPSKSHEPCRAHPVLRCARELRTAFRQYTVLVEVGGPVQTCR